MGLDMNLYRVKRELFESVNSFDIWSIDFEQLEDLIYWRKKYEIDQWFWQNTSIKEECSEELTKEKLESLQKWLIKRALIQDSEKIKEVINNADFINYVIFYSYCN